MNLRTDKYAKLIRTRTGVNPNAPVLGQPIITLLRGTNLPQMDLLSDSDVYVTSQVVRLDCTRCLACLQEGFTFAFLTASSPI